MAQFILYTGPMFSSKTTRLLMEADTRQYRKENIITFKAKLDDRYSKVGEIVTHNFNKIPAHLANTGDDILQKIAEQEALGYNIDTVLIDELFLIEESSLACISLFKKGYTVIASSIDLSFTGEPFKEVKEVMPYCTKIIKCSSVCSVCQEDARYTAKKRNVKIVDDFKSDSSIELIQVGGSELYEPRCQKHYNYMQE